MEYESVGIIVEERRTGSLSQLLFLWFSSNMQLTTIVTGALAASLHISLTSALVGIIVGNLLGGSIMGLHAAQGPRMPSPQMILSRAQFGLRGASLAVVIFSVMYIGFMASTTVIGGKLLTAATHLPYILSLLVLNAVVTLLVFFGNVVIQQFQRIAAYLFLAVFVYLSMAIASHPAAVHSNVQSGHLSWAAVLTMAGIAVTWQISYTPYVSDYSRQLHERTPIWKPFLFAGLGTFASSTWMMLIGALTANSGTPKSRISDGTFVLGYVPKPWQWLIYVLLITGIIAVNIFNLYGGYISTLSLFVPSRKPASSSILVTNIERMIHLAAIGIFCTAISWLGSGNFLSKYETFLSFLLYFLIPWSAISLMDFYVIRRGRYDTDGLLGLSAIYKTFNVPTLTVYMFAVLSEFLMLETPIPGLWHQFVWLDGMLVSALLYVGVNSPWRKRV